MYCLKLKCVISLFHETPPPPPFLTNQIPNAKKRVLVPKGLNTK